MKQVKRALSSAASVVVLTTAFWAAPEHAEAQNYMGQIIQVGENFCPRATLEAAGQLLPISSNTALFSLFGTVYGGDGRTTFGLPDLRSRSPVGQGSGPEFANYPQGARGGTETQTLTDLQLPNHSHVVRANNLDGDKPGPDGKLLAAAPAGGTGTETIYSDQPPTRTMSDQMIAPTGGNQSFSTEDPFLVNRFCVVIEGIFPSRP